jgi:predicted PurR-regulated permease PerM
MAIVGLLTTTGLWLLGVPIALMFGAMAALSEFIPNIGPVLSMAPALLVSFGKSASLAGWVFLVYLGVQLLESYVISPIVQQRETHVPAPLLIFCQVLLGYLGGGLGLILAAPLTASVLVLVRMLYLEDVLGEPEARKS